MNKEIHNNNNNNNNNNNKNNNNNNNNINNNDYEDLDYLKNNNLEQYINTLKKYFPNEENINYKNLELNKIGLYSISKPAATKQIIEIIKDKLNLLNLKPENLTITDATAGLGGDTIAFAHEFKAVNSIEIQEPHHKAIKNNAELFNLTNIKHINADYTKVYSALKQDIVFIDSPWGGTEYSANNIANMRLFGSKLPFIDFIQKLLDKQTIIFLKTPSNFDLEGLRTIINKTNNTLLIDNVYNFLLISIY